MKRNSFAFVLALTVATSIFGALSPRSAALAQNAQSNQNLDAMANRINQDIALLKGDQADYGGHRVSAVASMITAHKQIRAAEQYAVATGHGAGAANPGNSNNMAGAAPVRSQAGSNEDIANVRTDLKAIIGQLNADNSDYGGHKGQAITALQNAVNELGAALEYRRTHAGGT